MLDVGGILSPQYCWGRGRGVTAGIYYHWTSAQMFVGIGIAAKSQTECVNASNLGRVLFMSQVSGVTITKDTRLFMCVHSRKIFCYMYWLESVESRFSYYTNPKKFSM